MGPATIHPASLSTTPSMAGSANPWALPGVGRRVGKGLPAALRLTSFLSSISNASLNSDGSKRPALMSRMWKASPPSLLRPWGRPWGRASGQEFLLATHLLIVSPDGPEHDLSERFDRHHMFAVGAHDLGQRQAAFFPHGARIMAKTSSPTLPSGTINGPWPCKLTGGHGLCRGWGLGLVARAPRRLVLIALPTPLASAPTCEGRVT